MWRRLAGVMDAFSIGLQYGVPMETSVQKFTNLKLEPAGLTDDPDVRMSQAIMDDIFRRLALDHLPFETRSKLEIYSAEELQRQLDSCAPVRRMRQRSSSSRGARPDKRPPREDLNAVPSYLPTPKTTRPLHAAGRGRSRPLATRAPTLLVSNHPATRRYLRDIEVSSPRAHGVDGGWL